MSSNSVFPYYIEDWLLYLANRVTENGEEIDFPFFRNSPIKLANYDRSFVWNTASQISNGLGLSDRQLETAIIIITKHQRQIHNKTRQSVDYIEVQKPLRLPVRRIDRNAKLIKNVEKKRYELKFPYNRRMIDEINLIKNETGISEFWWDKNNRRWLIDAAEPNLECLSRFLNNRTYFEIDSEAQQDLDLFRYYNKNSSLFLPTVDRVGTDIIVQNSNSEIDQALEADQYKDFTAVEAAFCAHLYGLTIGENLHKYIQTHYGDIANAVLCTPAEINAMRHVYSETLPKHSVESLIKNFNDVDVVFVSTKDTHNFFHSEKHRLEKQYPGRVQILNAGSNQAIEQTIDQLPKNSVVVMDIQEAQNHSLRRSIHLNERVSDYIDTQAIKVLYIQTLEESKDLFI